MLGSNNNQNQGEYAPNFYSKLKFKNDTDKVQMTFSYWKGALKCSISTVPAQFGTRPEELAYIHLSPIKAHTLAGYVKEMIENPETKKIYGINTGASETQGLAAMGYDNGVPYIILAKIDKNGAYTQSQRFNFNHDYHYGLIFEDLDNLLFTKEYNNLLELQEFHMILEDYVHSANGALAQSVWETGKYECLNTLNRIADKVGAGKERRGGMNAGGGVNESFFANGGAASNKSSGGNFSGMNKPAGYTSGSIDDLEGEFEE